MRRVHCEPRGRVGVWACGRVGGADNTPQARAGGGVQCLREGARGADPFELGETKPGGPQAVQRARLPRPVLHVLVQLRGPPVVLRGLFELPQPVDRAGRKLLCGGGGMAWKSICPFPPLPLLGRRAGRGVWAGAALPAVPGGGGGPTPTYMAQNDPHVALIILTTHMWGKIFS